MFSEDYSYKCILISVQAVVNTYLEAQKIEVLLLSLRATSGSVAISLFQKKDEIATSFYSSQ